MNITILGTGFASLTAIAKVRKKLPNANIRVIAPSDEFIYYPSLIWIPSGKRSSDDVIHNLTKIFDKYNVEFTKARVTGIADSGRTVHTDAGDYQNDALIIATGSELDKDLPGIENTHIICQGVKTAQSIKQQLEQKLQQSENTDKTTIAIGCDSNPAEPSAKRGVGAVLEFVLGIDQLLRQRGKRDQCKLVFFSNEDNPMLQLGNKASTIIQKRLDSLAIETEFGSSIKGFEAGSVHLETKTIAADIILFQPAMKGAQWLDNSELSRSPAGLIVADEYAQVDGFANTYVAGEAGSYPGPDWQPKLGVNANIQANVAAHNLAIDINKTGAAKKTITVKLIYIIDSLSQGIFIKRTEKSEKAIKPLKLFHFAKLVIERLHLRKFR